MKVTKASEVLTQAARRIERDLSKYGCCAIDLVTGDQKLRDRAMSYFVKLKPLNVSVEGAWFGYSFIPENQDRRVVALTLAAAIARSNGD
jgi:hypothetical protein